MSEPHDNGGVPDDGRPSGAITTLWGWLVDGMAAFGTVLIVVLMVIICSDVVARNFFGASLPVVAELSALTLVMIVYLQLATAIRHNRLARTDFLLSSIEEKAPRLGAVINAGFNLVGMLVIGVIAWSTLGILEADMDRGRYIGVTGVLTVPSWPFRAIILFGVTVATIQYAIQLISAFSRSAPSTPEATS